MIGDGSTPSSRLRYQPFLLIARILVSFGSLGGLGLIVLGLWIEG